MHRISISLVRGGVSMLRRMILLCREEMGREREGGEIKGVIEMKVEGGGRDRIKLAEGGQQVNAKWTSSRH